MRKITEEELALGAAEVDAITQRFKELGYSSIRDFCREKSSLPTEAYASVMYRRQRPGTKNLIIIMSELGFRSDEIADYLQKRGETVLTRMLRHSDLDEEERALLERYRTLDEKKKEYVGITLSTIAA